MLTKPYSLALPLFGAFLLSGCMESTYNKYDIPVLLGSNLKQAEAILGKSSPNDPAFNDVMLWKERLLA